MKEKTAAAYARYSTDNQTENSIEYQMHEITGYCLKNHIKLTHQFVDEGCSGTNTDRASFQRMIEAARRGEFSNIIIYDISRGSRDVADWFSFRRLMRELHVNVISCHQQLGDPLDPDAFLREFISVGLGQHMVLETRQKSLDGMDAAARKGLFLGGVTPFGFGVKNQRYFIVESEAAIVREVFRLYADGYSYDYIMDKLDLSHVIGRHGAPMSRNSLYYMLKNARYAGIYTWNAHTYQVMRKYVGRQDNPRKTSIPSGAIPPIVDMETLLRVQERMKKNKNRPSRPPIKKRVFLLSSIARAAARTTSRTSPARMVASISTTAAAIATASAASATAARATRFAVKRSKRSSSTPSSNACCAARTSSRSPRKSPPASPSSKAHRMSRHSAASSPA